VIAGAVLCPAAPLLIPGVADALAAEEPGLAVSVRTAAAGLLRRSDRIVIVTPGRRTSWTPRLPEMLGADPFGRSDGTGGPCASRSAGAPLAGAPRAGARSSEAPAWAAGTWVGRRLLPNAPLAVLEVGDGDDDVELPTDLRDQVADEHTGVLVLADGATCHGAPAPTEPDAPAGSFEQSLHAVLATGDPARLLGWCRSNRILGRRLGATAPRSLAVLAELASGRRWAAAAHYLGAPFGVGYHVAAWWR